MRCVSPEEGANFACHLHCPVNGQLLECLHVECSIIEFAFRAFFSMNTLALAKHLSHRSTYFLAPHRENKYYSTNNVGFRLWERAVVGASNLLIVKLFA